VGPSPPAQFGGDALASDDAEGVAQEEAVIRPQAETGSACRVSEIPSCSWRGSWRAWAIQSRKLSILIPSCRATWLTGTLRDHVSRTARWRNSSEYGATYGRMIVMGRSAKVAVAGSGWSVADVPGIRVRTGTGTMRRLAMMSPCPASAAGAFATVH